MSFQKINRTPRVVLSITGPLSHRDPTARRTIMFDTTSASKGVKLALLEGQLLSKELDRMTFVARASDLGLPVATVSEAAEIFLAIAANQTARRAALRSS